MARTKVARTRLTQSEFDKFEADAEAGGFVNPSEYLRSLIVGAHTPQDLPARVASLERRVEHLEQETARKWLQEEHHGGKVG